MNATISISVERVLDSVYAHSAAEIVSSGVERPEVLGRNHRDMLRVITRDTIAGLAFTLAHIVEDTNVGDTPIPDVITLDLRLPEYLSLAMLQACVETAVAAGVLAQAWSGSDGPMAERYSKAYSMSLKSIEIHAGGSIPGSITPTA